MMARKRGQTREEGKMGTEGAASQRVRDFLAVMERRDLEAAKNFLAPGFVMIFPGDVRMTTLEELIDWSRERYARVGKVYERFDEVETPEGTMVYCFGTLAGDWLDDTPFSDIRFIDRFTVRDGKFVDQRVWNDMAEARGAELG
jgi:hypothetical protein